ncbi:MAG TPA: hypothetical protein VES65_04035 [Solirubrobacteraceae bacterium]|nr:hypothetical protein [Solirubrobacteraceae bacterium]
MLGVCLVAVLMVSAVAAVSASASLPEWGGCEATPGGKYTDGACTVRASHHNGTYEWNTGANFGKVWETEHGGNPPLELQRHFLGSTSTVSQIGPSTFETSTGKKMECQEGAIAYQLENASTKGVRDVYLHLYGCEVAGHSCESGFYGPGEVTNEEQWFEEQGFKGKLGFVSGKESPEPVVGLSLTSFRTAKQWKEKNEEEHNTGFSKTEPLLFAECKGLIGSVKIGGGRSRNTLISLITPVDQMRTEYTQVFTQTGGVQQPSAFEGKTGSFMGVAEALEEPIGWSTPPITIRPEERFEPEVWLHVPPIEIKARP